MGLWYQVEVCEWQLELKVYEYDTTRHDWHYLALGNGNLQCIVCSTFSLAAFPW